MTSLFLITSLAVALQPCIKLSACLNLLRKTNGLLRWSFRHAAFKKKFYCSAIDVHFKKRGFAWNLQKRTAAPALCKRSLQSLDMKISVVSRSGTELINGGLELHASATVSDLQQAIYSRTKKLYPARQRLTLPSQPGEKPVVLNPKKKLSDYTDGKTNGFTLVFKDLGPQVSYRTLFFWEYFGPLVIYPIFYLLPIYKLFGYEEKQATHPVQTYAFYYWCFHYIKRILETFFVHRFSHATSPISNVYRNSAYYWTFAACIGYSVNHPLYSPVRDLQWKIGFGFGIICQISNLYCHIILKDLRSCDGVVGYQIPRGFLFNFVTCANYTTEIYQWLAFNIATQTLPGYLFLLVGTRFMFIWAVGKHTRLIKMFDGKDGRLKYPRRWVFLPPFY